MKDGGGDCLQWPQGCRLERMSAALSETPRLDMLIMELIPPASVDSVADDLQLYQV
ncbi:hypothetical protein M8C21_008236 [Ambrosia artemisiifolia]|uniref:Uncharacterized protein n=1 Tax=Ambrosia artemisiifolia TaxID=4212 RepID=A0AAD5CPV0_AMBAR|nr:hypothetical protein M8C21_008236 [Ambrosia artemisiifolia]